MEASASYKLASRASRLALWQAHFVQKKLEQAGLATEIKTISTSGDRWKNKALSEIGGKGVFVKELEEALLAKTADLAVHSLKDLPARTKSPFHLACVFPRDPASDVLIFSPSWQNELSKFNNRKWQASDLKKLGPLTIGTGSVRRVAMLQEASSEIKAVPIRGNVDTRLTKLAEGQWDAIVLSQASIHRLNLVDGYPWFELDPTWFIPCAAQGVVAVETLEAHPLKDILQKIVCKDTEKLVAIERSILAYFGGDCNLPVGVHATIQGEKIHCDVVVFAEDGKSLRISVKEDVQHSGEKIANSIWNLLLSQGVEAYLPS